MSAPQPFDPNPDPNQQDPRPSSEKQQEASRENGKKSQGPKTPEGKEKSKMNAVKHGLTSKTTNPEQLLLSDENREEYQAFLEKYLADLGPKTQDETDLVDRITATSWRMSRLVGIETELLEKGRYVEVAAYRTIGTHPNGNPITEFDHYETTDRGLSHSFRANLDTLERLHKYERMLTSEFYRAQRLFHQNRYTKLKLAKEERRENSKNEPEPNREIRQNEPGPKPTEIQEIQNEPKPEQKQPETPAAKPQPRWQWEPSPGHPDYRPLEKNKENEENSKTNPRNRYFTDLFQALTSGILPPPFPNLA